MSEVGPSKRTLTHASNIVRVGWLGDAIGGDRYLLLSIAKNAAQERRAGDKWSAGHIDIKAADYPEEQNGKSRDEQTQDIEDHVGQADPATRFPRLDSIRSLGNRGHLAHTAPRGLQRNCERCAHKPP